GQALSAPLILNELLDGRAKGTTGVAGLRALARQIGLPDPAEQIGSGAVIPRREPQLLERGGDLFHLADPASGFRRHARDRALEPLAQRLLAALELDQERIEEVELRRGEQ